MFKAKNNPQGYRYEEKQGHIWQFQSSGIFFHVKNIKIELFLGVEIFVCKFCISIFELKNSENRPKNIDTKFAIKDFNPQK